MQNNVISRSYRLLNRILASNPFIRKKNRPSVNKHLKHDVVDIYLGETTFSPTKPSLTTNKRMEIIFMTTMTKILETIIVETVSLQVPTPMLNWFLYAITASYIQMILDINVIMCSSYNPPY